MLLYLKTKTFIGKRWVNVASLSRVKSTNLEFLLKVVKDFRSLENSVTTHPRKVRIGFCLCFEKAV